MRHEEVVDGNACFRESDDYPPTITATASALWCLWQLGAMPEDRLESIADFVASLLTEYDNDCWAINNSHEEEAFLCSTYYGLRTLFSIKEHLGERAPGHTRVLEKRAGIRKFIASALIPDVGYAAKPGEWATMIHTKDALAMMKKKYELGYELDAQAFESTRNTASSMIELSAYTADSLCAGFSLSEYYFPNVYGTLLSLDMMGYLKSLAEENQVDAGAPISEAFSDVETFIHSCWNDENQAFRGYSYNKRYFPASFLRRGARLEQEHEEKLAANSFIHKLIQAGKDTFRTL